VKILLVHNHYGSGAPSGENRVFELERDLLRRNGHEVETFERHSDTLRLQGKRGMVQGALTTPWNPITAQAVKKTITLFRPDVVHAHNTFPMISPSIFAAAQGCARVLTLHNYRLVCPAAIPMRNGSTCTECIDKSSVMPSLRYGCYRSSRLATLPLAASVSLHRRRGTWKRDVEAFIALSEFQRGIMVRAGLPMERISVKPNFYPGNPLEKPFDQRPSRVVFAGRLGAEKGVEDLIQAWLSWGADAPELRILGDGELRAQLEAKSKGARNIVFLGQVGPAEAEGEIEQARLLVLPSRWFEGFPMVLREAFALGTPVAVSDKGPLPEIASQADGVLFRANDPAHLLSEVRNRWSDTARLSSMALASKRAFYSNYSEQKNLEMLLDIYDRAMFAARAGNA
jgi:glycosyltransferase involved in cell wall biosynthesis